MDFTLIAIVIIYLFIIASLAYFGYKGTKSASDYLLAGRDTHPYIMAISYGATFISTSAIVGFGGVAAIFGMGLLWLTALNILVGIFIAFVFFGKRTRRMGLNIKAHTFPEFLGNRFQSPFLQGAGGALIFISMPLYASVVLMGGAKFMMPVLGIPYDTALFTLTAIVTVYVIMGGLKGVMYTDAFQGSIMFVGMSILLVATYAKLGGPITAHQQLTDMGAIAIDTWGKVGHTGWTAFPTFGSNFWYVLVTTLIMGVGFGVLAQPQLIVRFMTVKSDKELHRAVLVGGIFILLMTGVAFIVGALSNVYFMQHPDYQTIAIKAAKSVDNIIPLYISEAMPSWFTALFMVTLLSAAMSTLSSQFHAMGTSIGRDIYEKTIGGRGKSILITQLGILVAILLSLFLAWGLPKIYDGATAIIARGTAIFFGLCASSFLPIYIGGLYSRRITRPAAISGFSVGFLTSLFWLLFIHAKESSVLKLCKALSGKDSLVNGTEWANLAVLDPIVPGFLLAAFATILVTFLSKPPAAEHLDNCFKGIK